MYQQSETPYDNKLDNSSNNKSIKFYNDRAFWPDFEVLFETWDLA